MDFRILGSFEVVSDGQAAELGPPKQRAVLAVLLLHANEIVPTDRLIELVWGDRPPRTAAHSIYVSDLRKVLEPLAGGPLIVTRPPGYVLRADPDSIDARRFERLMAEAADEVEAGEPIGAEDKLRAALDLWRGRPLSDFPYEEFSQPEIRRLEGLRLDAIEQLAAAKLASGREQEILPLIEAVVREDPLRERAREFQMLALYRAGRQAEALQAFQQFRGLLAEELGLDPSPALRRLQERILLHDPSLGLVARGEATRTRIPLRNPYKGLRPFGEEDADDFFGREDLVDRLLDALAGGIRLLTVVGPSGCGKSSVVSAGLIPALRKGALPGSDRWVIAQMLPGGHPFEELEAALRRGFAEARASLRLDEKDTTLVEAARRLLPGGGRLVLVIDQFEELFSVPDEAVRASFLQNLATAAADPLGQVVVVLTLRADFYDRPLLHSDFAAIFTRGVVNVLPMKASEIEAAVVAPARKVGVDVDPALLAEAVVDTVDRPGALPLLQYALTELFDRRNDSELTLDEYRSLGGLQGALFRRAEDLYGRLNEERQHVAMQVFLRLVRLGEGTRDARRRVPVGELTALDLDPIALSEVLEEFGRHRLLSFDRDPVTGDATVEVAHEALLWEWKRLAEWIDRHRDDLRRHHSFATAVEEWESAGRDPDYLLTGSRLAEFDEWGRVTTLRLTEREHEFLDAGRERRRQEQDWEAERLEGQRRLERRARGRLWALAAALTLLIAVATYGVLAWLGNRPPDVVLVFDGRDDAGFNDMIEVGFDGAVSRFDLDAEKVPENRFDLEATLRRLSEDGVKLLVVGYGGEPDIVEAVATDYPRTRYIAIDFAGALPNVSYLTFAEEEGSFLAGAAAALKSQTGIIGFIGGVNVEDIQRFQAGYEAGARAVDPNVEVRSTYLTEPPDFSGFASPTLGAQAAEHLYDEGADVIYHAAGSSGEGLFETARERSEDRGKHLWAIGVDTDQYRSLPVLADFSRNPDLAAAQPYVLTSMVKRLDRAIHAALADYSRGVFIARVREFDLSTGAMDISYSGGFIDDIRPVVEDLRQRIIAGEISVPRVPAKMSPVPAP